MKNILQTNLENEIEEKLFLFHQGTYYHAYEIMGCHLVADGNKNGAYFRTWAPNAKSVSVLGDFNGWSNNAHIMKKISKNGVWEVFVDNVKMYDKYKFEIVDKKNISRLKTDPYAFMNETNGKTASIVYDIEGYKWGDQKYLKNKEKVNVYESPMNIYEVNFGSFKRNADGSYYTYRQYADELVPYLKQMGYTHVEVMPINEYPFDGSWGYQVTGYFSTTTRFGEPKDFMYFVDQCHKNNIGVILDWVPAHFPKDSEGLIEFDGKPLYECQGKYRMEHKDWGTRIFDYGREEVQSFLISSVMLFLNKYHIDGFRVDAVASMLYLDYGRKHNEWTPNQYGKNENLEAVAFLQKLNTAVFKYYANTLMIAEESTAWPLVSKPVSVGGLGFNFKWNIGWMNDTLEYVQTDPFFRKDIHEKLTFSFFYAFSENFVLHISHDEVVHGKNSLLNKMFGEYHDKFSTMRAYLSFMYSHPGKKLLFMGTEFGQFIEWNHSQGLDFGLLKYPAHKKMLAFTKALNKLYAKNSELHEIDYDWAGFEWVVSDDKSQNVLVFNRYNKNKEFIIIAVNFSAILHKDYEFGVPQSGQYEEIFSSDNKKYGGNGITNSIVQSKHKKIHGKNDAIAVTLPPLSAVLFKKVK